jgi:hypothetical protein
MKRFALAATVIIILGLFGAPALASPVLSQPAVWSGNGTDVGISWTSQTSNGTGFVAFDDFMFGTDTLINEITWEGIFLNSNLTNGSPNTSRWDVIINSSTAGLPSGLIVANTNVSVTTTTLGTGLFGGNPVTVYQFTAQFPAFDALANTQYWISPVSVGPTFAPFFSWIQGTGGDGFSAQVQLSNFNPVADGQQQGDRALTLSRVPEPTTVTLLGLGLAALALGRRRSRA